MANLVMIPENIPRLVDESIRERYDALRESQLSPSEIKPSKDLFSVSAYLLKRNNFSAYGRPGPQVESMMRRHSDFDL
jgi:hypothetical protein